MLLIEWHNDEIEATYTR